MIRRVLQVAAIVATVGWLLDRLLARRAGGGEPEPVRVSVEIDAPPDVVWEPLADIPGQPRWMHDLSEVVIEGDGPIGVGTRAAATVTILGIAMPDPVEIDVFDPPRAFGVRHLGWWGGTGRIELEPLDGGRRTRVEWTEALVPPMLPHLAAAIEGPIFARVFRADLERLKALVEGSGEADPGASSSGSGASESGESGESGESSSAPAAVAG